MKATHLQILAGIGVFVAASALAAQTPAQVPNDLQAKLRASPLYASLIQGVENEYGAKCSQGEKDAPIEWLSKGVSPKFNLVLNCPIQKQHEGAVSLKIVGRAPQGSVRIEDIAITRKTP